MNKRTVQNIVILKLLALALALAGCAQQTPAPSMIKAAEGVLPIRQAQGMLIEQGNDISTADLIQVFRDVLAGMYFTIEKADARSGVVRTKPLPGAQFFEFWRSDNIGAENTLAANLHTIRRTVILDISRRGMEISIGCEVHVQRLSLPEQHLRGGSRVYDMFSQSSRSLQRLKLNPEQAEQMAWIDLGRDRLLEEEILRRTKSCCVLRAASCETRNAEPRTQNAERGTENEI